MKEYSNYWKALTFAFKKYGNLKRKSDDIPYVVHPIRITAILRAAGFSENEDEDIMIAALFHDLIEDTETSLRDIENNYGKKVASIVKELSKPEHEDKDEWIKSFKTTSNEAKIVKMVDRIDNLMDLNISYWSAERKKSYAKQGRLILETCGHVNEDIALELKKAIQKILND